MLKKVFMAAIIVTVLFPWQLYKSDEIKSKEKIIANSPDSLKEFLLKTATGLKNHVEAFPFPKKGEFETTGEYNIRLADWKAKGGLENSILYKATGLFPVKLGEYNADKERFYNTELAIFLSSAFFEEPIDPQWKKITFDIERTHRFSPLVYRVNIIPVSLIEEIIVSHWSSYCLYVVPGFWCPREKARILRGKNLRCDIVFSLDYAPAPDSDWNYRHELYLKLHNIKFYSLETGDILLQASVKK